jgi:hypothetical protein
MSQPERGIDETSEQGGRFGQPSRNFRQRSAPSRRSRPARYTALAVNALVRQTSAGAQVRVRTAGTGGDGEGGRGRCVAQTRRNRRAGRCNRRVTLPGHFTLAGHPGANRFAFTGRIGGKRLKSGSYRLVATPTAVGRTGQPVSASFRIVT